MVVFSKNNWTPVFNTFNGRGISELRTRVYSTDKGIEFIRKEGSTLIFQNIVYTEPTITITSGANLEQNQFDIDLSRPTGRKVALKTSVVESGSNPTNPSSPTQTSSNKTWVWITAIVAPAAIVGVIAWYCMRRSRLRSESQISTNSLSKNTV